MTTMIDPTPAIRATCPHLTDAAVKQWAAAFVASCPRFGITTAERVAGLIGQCVVESNGFVELQEITNYSAAGLRATFPNEFPDMATALRYARQPEKIACHAYANRMGNGDESSGDGWTFRGLGPTQTTGRDDISRAAAACGLSPSGLAAVAQTPDGGADLACWDWQDMGCDVFADRQDWRGLSIRVNGGTEALADRIAMCTAALKALEAGATSSSGPAHAALGVQVAPAVAPAPSAADALMAAELQQLNQGDLS